MNNKIIRGLFVYLRMLWFIKFKKRLKSLDPSSLKTTSKLTLESNRRRVVSDPSMPVHPTAKTFLGLDLDVFGSKSSVFLKYISLKYSTFQISRMKVLIIGPRNESEIFNFQGCGFSLKNIKAVDLFSYSDMIELGDMHDLRYDDCQFDLVYAGWVISYSEDRSRAINEMLRVCKVNGEIAYTATLSQVTNEEIVSLRGYMIGSRNRLQTIADLSALLTSSLSKGFISLCTSFNIGKAGIVSFQKLE